MGHRPSAHRRAVLAQHAATMRVAPTTTEALLWSHLSGSARRRLSAAAPERLRRVVRVPADLVAGNLDAAVAVVAATLNG